VSSFFNQNQIEKIVSYAFAAGAIAEEFQKSGDFQTAKKFDNSSVTTADIAVSEFINQKLKKDFPEIPIICEEGKLRQGGDIFWLIDPIDGTNSFIDGSTEFAVNIALIKDKPFLV
jgi:3'(2'), 5'-bisphosphate nucleotidase